MKRKRTGEFLYHTYRETAASFLDYLYRSNITGNPKHLHSARVAFKRLFALRDLFGMIYPGRKEYKSIDRLFGRLYRLSGKIREIQVNRRLLDRPGFRGPGLHQLLACLDEEERLAGLELMQAIRDFKEPQVKKNDRLIRKLCLDNPVSGLHRKTARFLLANAAEIARLQSGRLSDRKIHRIRRHLKSMSTVVMLAGSAGRKKTPETITEGLGKAELLIGEWHDRIVLLNMIDRYTGQKGVGDDAMRATRILRAEVADENRKLLDGLMPEVSNVLLAVLGAVTGEK